MATVLKIPRQASSSPNNQRIIDKLISREEMLKSQK
jgi:hypothetical protein